MHLLQPDPAAALLGLRAMKTVASATGPMSPVRRTLLDAARRVILRVDADIDALAPITPTEFAAGFALPELREQFTNGMLVMALSDGVPPREMVADVEAFAKAIGVSTPALTDLRLLAEGYMTIFKIDFLRRSQIADIMKNQFEQKGPLGLAKAVLTMRGMMEDPALAATLPRLEGPARGNARPIPGRVLCEERLQPARRTQGLPGSGPLPRSLPRAGRLRH